MAQADGRIVCRASEPVTAMAPLQASIQRRRRRRRTSRPGLSVGDTFQPYVPSLRCARGGRKGGGHKGGRTSDAHLQVRHIFHTAVLHVHDRAAPAACPLEQLRHCRRRVERLGHVLHREAPSTPADHMHAHAGPSPRTPRCVARVLIAKTVARSRVSPAGMLRPL